MKTKLVIISLVLLCTILITGQFASAISARMGGTRMIIRADVNQNVEKVISIENVNDVPVTINIKISGDLASNVEFQESESFKLESGEKRDARFTIYATESGTTTTRINVAFVPEEGGSAGLTSTVTFVASDPNNLPPEEEDTNPEDNDDLVDDDLVDDDLVDDDLVDDNNLNEDNNDEINKLIEEDLEKELDQLLEELSNSEENADPIIEKPILEDLTPEQQNQESEKKSITKLLLASTIILVAILVLLFSSTNKTTNTKRKKKVTLKRG